MAEQVNVSNKSRKILTTAGEIKEYLGVSETLFKKMIRNGLPARLEDGRWYAHTDNLDEFFRHFTMVPARQQRGAVNE